MSCLSLRLPPARKAWRSFTSKLRTRLHKSPNPFKKHKNPKSRANKQRLCLQSKKGFGLPPCRRALSFALRRKKPAPVYVDRLFREAPIPNPVECTKNCTKKVLDDPVGPEMDEDRERESMAGIDQRAEVFIARFRAEMEHQEKLARGYL